MQGPITRKQAFEGIFWDSENGTKPSFVDSYSRGWDW